MPVHFEVGNLLDAPVDYICHQVNCQGRMGSGIAKQIRNRWPIVYDSYKEWCNYWDSQATMHGPQGPDLMLGHIIMCHVSQEQTVINMAAQLSYGYDGRRYTSYDAFWSCLGEIKACVPKGSAIGFPYKIGCGLGGANWKVIEKMIEEVLGFDYNVYIYMLEEEL